METKTLKKDFEYEYRGIKFYIDNSLDPFKAYAYSGDEMVKFCFEGVNVPDVIKKAHDAIDFLNYKR